MNATPTEQEKRALLNKLLKAEGTVFLFGGIFFLLKDKFSDFVLIDAQIDMYLGLAVFILGIANIIIADKFFPTGKQYD